MKFIQLLIIIILTTFNQSSLASESNLNNLFRGSGSDNPHINRSTTLSMPHRTDKEISDWLISAISESLSFKNQDINTDLQSTRDYFNNQGHSQYLEALRQQNIIPALQSGRFIVINYVDGMPLLINEGAIDGRYRWLFEVPVTLTFLPRGTTNYANAEPENKNVTFIMQVGRIEKADFLDIGIKIESWALK